MNSKKHRSAAGSGTEKNLRAVLRQLANTCRDPAHVVELYYWSSESDLVAIMRRYLALPDEPKAALRAFLTMTADCPESVQVSVTHEGAVTLQSSVVSELMQTIAAPSVKDNREEAVH